MRKRYSVGVEVKYACACACPAIDTSLAKMAKRGETDDLATLASLDEAVLLQELKRRYEQDKIYVSLVRGVHVNDC